MSNPRRNQHKKTDESEDDPHRLWCVCKTPYTAGQFMIQCDGCDEWYHGNCVGISEEMARDMDVYYCDACRRAGRAPANVPPHIPVAQPEKPKKNIRQEVVRHLEGNFKKALNKCKTVIDTQITTGKTIPAVEGAEGTEIAPEEIEKLKSQAALLVDLESNNDKLHQMAIECEKGIFDNCGPESEKPYRDQYRGLKSKLDSDKEHQFRMDILTGKIAPAELGKENVQAYVKHQ